MPDFGTRCMFLFSALLALVVIAAYAPGPAYGRPMFVFGSSYVDTGNVKNAVSSLPYPWLVPYGETWPGNPSGRYSNGHSLSDVIATALNLAPPTTFSQRVSGTPATEGLNFAVGGSGVVSAYGVAPISSQIDAFQSVAGSYAPEDLASALVLYAPAGDDYLYSLTVQNAPLASIYALSVSVGKQISVDLTRLYQLGLRKFAVTYLPPTGCLPIASVTNFFQSCNASWSESISDPHNSRIFKNILGLRHFFINGTIVALDLNTAFNSAQFSFGTGLKPCCAGLTPASKCGNLGAGGTPAYSVCGNPGSQFYWDDAINPTEAGWQAVVKQLQTSLNQLL